MVDSVEQLDFVDGIAGGRTAPLRVCIDVDAGLWLMGGRIKIGAKRSPLHDPEPVVALARAIENAPSSNSSASWPMKLKWQGSATHPRETR